MISACSTGLQTVGVAGDRAGEPAAWERLLAGRRVAVITGCDRAGRIAAWGTAGGLQAAGVIAHVVDLVPGRNDVGMA